MLEVKMRVEVEAFSTRLRGDGAGPILPRPSAGRREDPVTRSAQ
jgi:hypothetical protein